jgi:hypothetical protein
MKRQLETATEAPPELESRVGAESTGSSGRFFPTLQQFPILGVPYESKLQKLKMEEAVYETLRAEFDSAKVQEARENPYVEVLDLPEVPEGKSFPPRLLIVVTGTGWAVIVSGVWILGAPRWQQMDGKDSGGMLAREIFGTVRGRIAAATGISLRIAINRANPETGQQRKAKPA